MFPEKLLKGYHSFLGNRFEAERKRYETLAEGLQSPEIMVIGCCDSRVSPEIIFDARPGELFVVRNVANLVPPHETNGAFHGTSAALEFAVEVLNIKHIVVLGHQRCGGIRAYAEKMAPLTSGDFIGKWINMIAPAADMLGERGDMALDDYTSKLELASIGQSLVNLMTFGMVRRRVEAGTLQLHGACFGIGDGKLMVLDDSSKQFRPLAA
ncbi:MAG: carbonic anhydrase [Pseudomonadota bacterium]